MKRAKMKKVETVEDDGVVPAAGFLFLLSPFWRFQFGGGSREALPRVVERLREDARLGEDGHEVVVAVPTWDDVGVEVGDAATRDGGTEVKTDVEGVGF